MHAAYVIIEISLLLTDRLSVDEKAALGEQHDPFAAYGLIKARQVLPKGLQRRVAVALTLQ